MGKQGFRDRNTNPYVYHETDSGGSVAIGIDNDDGDKTKVVASTTAGATPDGTAQITVDPTANKVELPQEGRGVVQTDVNGVITSDEGTDGQLLIASSTVAPAWANILSADGTVTITNSSNGIDLSAPGSSVGDSAFAAYVETQVNNVTGDGTVYTIIYDTEWFDLNNDFDLTTGIFTVPFDGIYQFNVSFDVSRGAGSTSGSGDFWFFLTGTGPSVDEILVGNGGIPSNSILGPTGSITVQLDENDTVEVRVAIANNTATKSSILGGRSLNPANAPENHFSGFLVTKL